MDAPIFKEYAGELGVQVTNTGFGRLPHHIDLTAGNSEKVISYGARIRLDTMVKIYSSFVAGFYDSHRFMVDTIGRFHLGIQNQGVKRPQQWLRTDSEDGQPLVQVKTWHEVVFTIDARDPNRVLGYLFLDGKQQRNPHFAVNDDGVRSTGMNPFQVGRDPGNAGPPWYNGPLHGLISELIIEKGYLIEPTLPHTGPLNNRVNLGTKSVSARPGDTLTVPVLLTNYSTLSLSSCQFTLRVDAAVAEVLAVDKAGIAGNWTLGWTPRAEGAYAVVLGGLAAPMRYGEGALLNLTVKVSDTARDGDFSDLYLDDAKLDENRQLDVSTTTGRIRVEEAVLYGDANADGAVDSSDAMTVFAYLLETEPPPAGLSRFLRVSDVSGNGEVTSYDAALILQHAAGFLPDFPVRKGPKPLAKASGGLAARARLALSPARDLGDGMYEYRLLGENLETLAGAELAFDLDPGKAAQGVAATTTSLRGARLLAVRGTGSRYVLTLAVNDRFQDFGELAVIRVAQNAVGNALALSTAYLNEGGIQGDFLSVPVRGQSVGKSRIEPPMPAPGIRLGGGFLEILAGDSGPVSVTLSDAAGRPLLRRTLSGADRRVSLGGLPRGVFGYEVRAGSHRFRGRAVRL